ncbi:MAG: alpha/beta fold hydrolase [Acidimicrobiales bacterium]
MIRASAVVRQLGRAGALSIGAALLLTGCSGPPGHGASATTTPGGAGPTTTIVPSVVAGTTERGALSYLGAVDRMPVVAVPDGLASTKVPTPGTSSYREVVPVAYRQSGSGTSLVLIEGEDASMTWWSPPLIQALDQHYRVTIFDLPGVGYSGPPNAPLSIDWLADMTAGLLGELGLSQSVVLGWGMGGQVAVALTMRHPMLVGDLVVADTGMPTAGSQAMTSSAARLLGTSTATPTAISRLMFPLAEVAARHEWLHDLQEQIPDDVTSATISMQAHLESAFWTSTASVTGLRAMHHPVLVIAGDDDEVFPSADATSLAGAIGGAQHYLWNGAGYGALLQDPPQFVSVLQDFTG